MSKTLKILVFIIVIPFLLVSCKGPDGKYKFGGDARKFPADPEERVKQNLKEGRGFRLNDTFKGSRGGVFDFASSNPMWKASLDIIEFMPLSSVNYSGGIIITDWYSENNKDFIKITLRFLSNEVRSDAINIKIFYKECRDVLNCNVVEKKSNLDKIFIIF